MRAAARCALLLLASSALFYDAIAKWIGGEYDLIQRDTPRDRIESRLAIWKIGEFFGNEVGEPSLTMIPTRLRDQIVETTEQHERNMSRTEPRRSVVQVLKMDTPAPVTFNQFGGAISWEEEYSGISLVVGGSSRGYIACRSFFLHRIEHRVFGHELSRNVSHYVLGWRLTDISKINRVENINIVRTAELQPSYSDKLFDPRSLFRLQFSQLPLCCNGQIASVAGSGFYGDPLKDGNQNEAEGENSQISSEAGRWINLAQPVPRFFTPIFAFLSALGFLGFVILFGPHRRTSVTRDNIAFSMIATATIFLLLIPILFEIVSRF